MGYFLGKNNNGISSGDISTALSAGALILSVPTLGVSSVVTNFISVFSLIFAFGGKNLWEKMISELYNYVGKSVKLTFYDDFDPDAYIYASDNPYSGLLKEDYTIKVEEYNDKIVFGEKYLKGDLTLLNGFCTNANFNDVLGELTDALDQTLTP